MEAQDGTAAKYGSLAWPCSWHGPSIQWVGVSVTAMALQRTTTLETMLRVRPEVTQHQHSPREASSAPPRDHALSDKQSNTGCRKEMVQKHAEGGSK